MSSNEFDERNLFDAPFAAPPETGRPAAARSGKVRPATPHFHGHRDRLRERM